jgi:hypothetical protein
MCGIEIGNRHLDDGVQNLEALPTKRVFAWPVRRKRFGATKPEHTAANQQDKAQRQSTEVRSQN